MDYGPKIAEHRAKLAAEQAIQGSGVPYTFFRPTYFTNTLPRHVQGRFVVTLGRQPQVLHPVCAEDFTAQVARAFATPNRAFYIHGPQPLTLHATRGTRGHLGPGGRAPRGFVAGIIVLERGQRPGDPRCG